MLLSCRKKLVALLVSVTLVTLAAFLLSYAKNPDASEAKLRHARPTAITHTSNYSAAQWWESLRLDPWTEEEKEEERRGFRKHGFNQFRSDRLPLDRPVPDTRDPRCVDRKYPSGLPATSVVIIFHNEAYTALLRTITSVVNRTPPELLHEVVLVDDYSDHEDRKKKLEDWIAPNPKIKLVRHTKREGLIRARVTGANAASGEVLTFLDSHCECNVGWAEPLLERIQLDRTTVVLPVIDAIAGQTFWYSDHVGELGIRGGFTWTFEFRWMDIPEYEQKRRGYDETRELYTPMMLGCMFALERQFFFDIGTFDMQMEIWGAENLEISFRIWMCGGKMETIPCSHVGHVFRPNRPYSFPNGLQNTVNRNTMRAVEVWFDDYKKYFYSKRPDIHRRDFGDITERLALKEKLHCKPFKWFLNNVIPELSVPGEDYWHEGELRNPHSDLCLDTVGHHPGQEIGLYPCHHLGGNQDFGFTVLQEIQCNDIPICLDIFSKSGGPVLMQCHRTGGNQEWEYNNETHLLKHVATGNCLDRDYMTLRMSTCWKDSPTQQWIFSKHYTPTSSKEDLLRRLL